MLSFYGQLLEQLGVASQSRPTVFFECYSLSLLYCGQINDDDDDDDDNANYGHYYLSTAEQLVITAGNKDD